MDLVSALYVGGGMGLFDEPLTATEAFLLMRGLHPGHIAIEHLGSGDDAEETEIDHVRADILRERFAGFRVQDRRG